jgi:hypothetical protein
MGYITHLGGAESCGPDQRWDPDASFTGPDGKVIKGQCVAKGSRYSWSDIAKGALKVAGEAGRSSSRTVAESPKADNTLVYVGVGAVALLVAYLYTRD